MNINESVEEAKLYLYPSYVFSWDSVTKRQINKKKTVINECSTHHAGKKSKQKGS